MDMTIKSIGVFCGSSIGHDHLFRAQAKELGRVIAQRGLKLVYGGSHVGLMGVIADSAMENGAYVLGVLPKVLVGHELEHKNINQLIITEDMPERKKLIMEHSDAFIAMPGGFGTMDEIFEVIVYNQLKIHEKPVGFLNTNNYYDGILDYMKKGVDSGFLKEEHINNIVIDANPENLVARLKTMNMGSVEKWVREIKKDTNNI